MLASTYVIWCLAAGYLSIALLFFLNSALEEHAQLNRIELLICAVTAVFWPAALSVSILAICSRGLASEPAA